MKVLFDHQIYGIQKYGGISRYFYELTKELNSFENISTQTSLIFSNNHYIQNEKLFKHRSFFPQKEFRGKHRLLNPINKINSIQKISKKDYDIFHPTYYDPYFLKYIGNKPFVLTIYDMIHEKFKQFVSKNDHTLENKKVLAHKASKIIAISESTKQDIINILNIPEEKIEVVYLGSSMDINYQKQIKTPSSYLLFVGSRHGYKNFESFIKGIRSILNTNKELHVVCIGGGKFTAYEKQLFLQLNIMEQIVQYDLDDKSLACFYNNALAFIFPSLYEGFGIPILESFACHCPLICSNTSSLPEIAGDAACYFDPYSEESINKAVLKILEDSNLREELIINGCERLKQFSWQKTAEQTKKVYESILK